MKVITHKNMRIGFVAVATIASVALLSGCSGNSDNSASDGNSISVWVDTERMPALQDVANRYKEDTGITVNLVVRDFSTIGEDFISQVPTGRGPDILVSPHDKLGSYVQNGVVSPVEISDIKDQFAPESISAMTYNGAIYGLPYSVENIVMLRNTDLVKEPADNFNDMVAKSKDAMAAAPDKVKFPLLVGLDQVNSDPYHLYPFQTSFGNSVFAQNEDGTFDPSQLTIGDEAGQNFAKALGQWGNEGIINPDVTSDIALAEFQKGSSPFYITGPWNFPAVKDAGVKYAIDPVPSAGGQTAKPFLGVNGFFVSSRSENKVAVTKFLVDYLAKDNAQEELFKVGGRPPALIETYNRVSAEDPDVEAVGRIGLDGMPMPAIPEMAAVWNDWGVAQMEILRGRSSDPAATWITMSENIKTKL